MNKNTIILIIGAAVLIVGIFVYFKVTDVENNNSASLSAINNEEILAGIEKEIFTVASGGIHPDTYDEINLKLKKLEDQRFEPVRTQAVRVALGKLEVGGSQKPTWTPAPTKLPTNSISVKPPINTFQPQTSLPSSTPVPVASCKSNPSPIFTHHITDIGKINFVVPPPTIGAGHLKTHGYIGVGTRFPIYAPVDMTLNTGAYYEGGPYWLGFEVSCEVTLRFGHVDEPIRAIIDVFPSVPSPSNDSRDQKIKNKISFKAGDLIGYSQGEQSASSLDFGIYNSTTSNRYKEDPKWNTSWVYTTAVCPFDYFELSLKSAYTSKFSSTAMPGNPRDGESFCK